MMTNVKNVWLFFFGFQPNELLELIKCISTKIQQTANRIIIKASAVLTWILKESGWRTILSHSDALMILMHDISQWDCACEKHVLTQIRCCAS